MFKPLEPVFALLVRERHHRERFEVEFPPIEDHKTPTNFKVPRLKIKRFLFHSIVKILR